MKCFLLVTIVFLFSFSVHSQVIFQEDFNNIPGITTGGAGTYSFPEGWIRANVDNRTPSSSVSYVNQAWIRREDFQSNVSDSCAFSTSWYNPTGVADDWMWTPLIANLPGSCTLNWDARIYDIANPDGYEVRIMTEIPTGSNGVIGNMLTNSTLLYSVTSEAGSWTHHKVSLDAYTGQSVYIGFRNTSNDKFILLIDNVIVERYVAYDVQINSTDAISQYASIPLAQADSAFVLGGTISNAGKDTLHQVALNFKIVNQDKETVYSIQSDSVIKFLAPNSSVHLSAAKYTPELAGIYTVHYAVTMAETDQNPINDTLSVFAFQVTDSIYARDNNKIVGSLGIGAGVLGYLGQDFMINKSSYLSSVSIFYTKGHTGRKFGASIWNMKNGKPDTIIAATKILLYPDDSSRLYTIPMANGKLLLDPGEYLVAAIEFDTTLSVGQTSGIFTSGHTWVNWPTSPMGGWANNESFGSNFAKSYAIRMNFVNPCLSLKTDISSIDATCITCSDGMASAIVSGGISPYSYSWTNGSGNDTIVNLIPGEYTVTVTDDFGCISSKLVTIDVSIPELINTKSVKNVRIYPNPNNGNFTIELDDNSKGVKTITIISVTGKIVYSDQTKTNNIELKNLPVGIYLLQVENEKSKITERIVIKP